MIIQLSLYSLQLYSLYCYIRLVSIKQFVCFGFAILIISSLVNCLVCKSFLVKAIYRISTVFFSLGFCWYIASIAWVWSWTWLTLILYTITANSWYFTCISVSKVDSYLVSASQLLQACLSSIVIIRSLLGSWYTAAALPATPVLFSCSTSSL